MPAAEDDKDDKGSNSSTLLVIASFVVPIVLGGGGIGCVVMGKWINDSATLFYAGLALLAIAIGMVCFFCIYFAKHKSSRAGCLNGFLCLEAAGGCCHLGCLGADLAADEL